MDESGGDAITIATVAGSLVCRRTHGDDAITVNMGPPRSVAQHDLHDLLPDQGHRPAVCVDMGNPHCVLLHEGQHPAGGFTVKEVCRSLPTRSTSGYFVAQVLVTQEPISRSVYEHAHGGRCILVCPSACACAYECAWVCACVYACAVCVRVHMLLLLLVRFQLGPRLTNHVAFPCGTNVELVRVESRQRVRCVFRCCAILPSLLLRAIVLQLASAQIHCILQYEERLHRPGWVCSELLLHLELQPPISVVRAYCALGLPFGQAPPHHIPPRFLCVGVAVGGDAS